MCKWYVFNWFLEETPNYESIETGKENEEKKI